MTHARSHLDPGLVPTAKMAVKRMIYGGFKVIVDA